MRFRLISIILTALALSGAFGSSSVAHAGAILNGAITVGPNTLSDQDREAVTTLNPVRVSAGTLAVGDVLTDILSFTTIANLVGGDLNGTFSILFLPNYQLSSVGTFTVSSITDTGLGDGTPFGLGPSINLGKVAFTGTIAVYETADTVASANHISIATDSLSTLLTKAVLDTNILNVSGVINSLSVRVPIDFVDIANISTAHRATFGGGFNVTSNPGSVSIVTGVGGGGTFDGTPYDLTVDVNTWGNKGANAATVPISTQTSATFQGVPEPTSALLWAGLVVGGMGARRVRRRWCGCPAV